MKTQNIVQNMMHIICLILLSENVLIHVPLFCFCPFTSPNIVRSDTISRAVHGFYDLQMSLVIANHLLHHVPTE